MKIVRPTSRRRLENRSGVSLIELLVVISMFAAVMSLTGTTFYLLMRSEKLVTQSLVTERSISRLSVQFRDDVHQSVDGQVIAESSGVSNELILKDEIGVRVRYRATKDGVARLRVDGDKTIGRDDYRLPDCHVRITAGDEADSSLRTLVIERPAAMITRHPQAPKPLRSLKIQAYMNRRRPTPRQTQAVATVEDSTIQQKATEDLK